MGVFVVVYTSLSPSAAALFSECLILKKMLVV